MSSLKLWSTALLAVLMILANSHEALREPAKAEPPAIAVAPGSLQPAGGDTVVR